MSQLTFTTDLTIAELETSFSIYCKALRILILEERTINQIRRSVCWRRLSSLHEALPYRYGDPAPLYFLIKRECGK